MESMIQVSNDTFSNPAIDKRILADVARIQSAWLHWIAEASEGDFDSKIIETLVETLDAHARAYLGALDRENLLPEYNACLRRVGVALLQNAQQHSLLQDPYSEERLRKMAESSSEYILRKRSSTSEQQEGEIRNAVERLRLEFRKQSRQALEWRIQIRMRIETHFEARYRHWAAEAMEEVQRIADQPQHTTVVKRAVRLEHLARKWEDIEISLISDERVEIRIGNKIETRNYAEMGFQDRRTGKQNLLWTILQALARLEGTIPIDARSGQEWLAVEKRIGRMKKVLQKLFGMSDDPVPLIEGIGYRARFKIRAALASKT